MHLSLGHVTLVLGKFTLPPNFPPIGLMVSGGLTLGFAQNFQFFSDLYFVVEVLFAHFTEMRQGPFGLTLFRF